MTNGKSELDSYALLLLNCKMAVGLRVSDKKVVMIREDICSRR